MRTDADAMKDSEENSAAFTVSQTSQLKKEALVTTRERSFSYSWNTHTHNTFPFWFILVQCDHKIFNKWPDSAAAF